MVGCRYIRAMLTVHDIQAVWAYKGEDTCLWDLREPALYFLSAKGRRGFYAKLRCWDGRERNYFIGGSALHLSPTEARQRVVRLKELVVPRTWLQDKSFDDHGQCLGYGCFREARPHRRLCYQHELEIRGRIWDWRRDEQREGEILELRDCLNHLKKEIESYEN